MMREGLKNLNNSRTEKRPPSQQKQKPKESDDEDAYSDGGFEKYNGDEGETKLEKLRQALNKENENAKMYAENKPNLKL